MQFAGISNTFEQFKLHLNLKLPQNGMKTIIIQISSLSLNCSKCKFGNFDAIASMRHKRQLALTYHRNAFKLAETKSPTSHDYKIYLTFCERLINSNKAFQPHKQILDAESGCLESTHVLSLLYMTNSARRLYLYRHQILGWQRHLCGAISIIYEVINIQVSCYIAH